MAIAIRPILLNCYPRNSGWNNRVHGSRIFPCVIFLDSRRKKFISRFLSFYVTSSRFSMLPQYAKTHCQIVTFARLFVLTRISFTHRDIFLLNEKAVHGIQRLASKS